MKRLLLFVLMAVAVESRAQNWNPLGPVGVKRYFVNEIGYLRGMRVDSIRMVGGDSVFYPFRSLRGPFLSPGVLHTNGSSWLGKTVRKTLNGTWLFNTWRGDTVTIEPNAALGATWRFYDDTGTRWYLATVSAIDTQSILGTLDSVKTIAITAMSGTIVAAADSVNGWRVTLSKTHGFVNVPDLYTFPYPRGNTQEFDFFLALVFGQGGFTNSFDVYGGRARFHLTQYAQPTAARIYSAWQPTDALYYSFVASQTGWGTLGFFVDTVITRGGGNPSGDILNIKRWKWSTGGVIYPPAQSFYNLTLDSTCPVDTSLMPEEYPNDKLVYYQHRDTTYGKVGSTWNVFDRIIFDSTVFINGYPRNNLYKEGVGNVYYRSLAGDVYGHDHILLAYRIGNTTFGNPFGVPAGVSDASGMFSNVSISPIPASSSLRVHHPAATLTFRFTDAAGRTIHTAQSTPYAISTDIDVSRWSAGPYSMTATSADGSRHTQKVLIAR